MPVSDEALRRYKRQIAVYRSRTSSLLVAAWAKLPGYDEEHVEQYAERTEPALNAGKVAAVALSAAFFALAMKIRPVGVDPDEVDSGYDIRQPFLATWHALAMGRPFAEAVQVGRSTTQGLGFDFVQSSARRTGDVVAEKSGKDVRWRRVPGGKSCEWCHMVAGQTYRTAQSADFGHERDDCDVIPA